MTLPDPQLLDEPLPLHLNNRGNPRGGRERIESEARNRRVKALELRKAGATYQQVADQLGFSGKSGAYQAVQEALREITMDAAKEVRDLELSRLDRALLAIWTEVTKGSLPHIDRFLRIQDQRAKYLGLYSPIKLAPTDPTGQAEYAGMSDSDLVKQFSGLMESIRAREAARVDDGTEAPGPVAAA